MRTVCYTVYYSATCYSRGTLRINIEAETEFCLYKYWDEYESSLCWISLWTNERKWSGLFQNSSWVCLTGNYFKSPWILEFHQSTYIIIQRHISNHKRARIDKSRHNMFCSNRQDFLSRFERFRLLAYVCSPSFLYGKFLIFYRKMIFHSYAITEEVSI